MTKDEATNDEAMTNDEGPMMQRRWKSAWNVSEAS